MRRQRPHLVRELFLHAECKELAAGLGSKRERLPAKTKAPDEWWPTLLQYILLAVRQREALRCGKIVCTASWHRTLACRAPASGAPGPSAAHLAA